MIEEKDTQGPPGIASHVDVNAFGVPAGDLISVALGLYSSP